MNPPAPGARLRSRLTLILIAAMFLSSFLVAAALRFTGWTPSGSRNNGELLQPPIDLGGIELRQVDGSPYGWTPEKNLWRIVVVPAPGCADSCAKTLDALHRVWLNQGRKADRIDVLWFGPLPEGDSRFRRLLEMQPSETLNALLPEHARADALPVYLVDPSGFVALHYPAGFDPIGLRKDIGKLVK